MQGCNVGEIFRVGYCKANAGTGSTPVGSSCNEISTGNKRTKESCSREPFKDACNWVKGTCVKDQGSPGRVPPEKRVLPRMTGGLKLSRFMPGGKMPFNKTLDEIRNNCNVAGNKMQSKNVPKRSAIGKTVLAFNWNKRLEAPGAANWDSQRVACLDGIRAAYSR